MRKKQHLLFEESGRRERVHFLHDKPGSVALQGWIILDCSQLVKLVTMVNRMTEVI